MAPWPFSWFVAFRFLRSRKRYRVLSLNTAISVLGVCLGVATLIATLAVMTGFNQDLRDKILGTNAHIIVQDLRGEGIEKSPDVIRMIEDIPHVVAAAPFVHQEVMVASPIRTSGAVLRGILPEAEQRVTDLNKHLVVGNLRDLETGVEAGERVLPGIFLGSELARRLGVAPGNTVHVLTPSGMEGALGFAPKFRRFVVVGIFETGMYDYDATLAFIHLREAQAFLGLGDRVSAIQVRVDALFQAQVIAQAIEEALGPGYWARDWIRMNKNLFSALKMEKTVMFVILVLIILVASFNIIGTLTLMVLEKGREIAILKAMGATRGMILRIFLFQGLFIGGAGTIFGVPLGLGVSYLIGWYYRLPPDVYYISQIPIRVEALDVILVAVAAMGISFLATLYPSWQAARLDPAPALRYE